MNELFEFDDWIGFDFDGTLVETDGWKGVECIGKPIWSMWDRLKDHIARGDTVKIFTARVCGSNADKAHHFIKEWLKKNNFPDLEITNVKDHGCKFIYDDRVVQVERNTGQLIGELQGWMMH